MSPKSTTTKKPAEQVIKDIRRATRRHFSAEDKIRIMLDGLRGEYSIAELCRKEGICQRRSKNPPRGGVKVGHLRAPEPGEMNAYRAPAPALSNGWRAPGRIGP